jgi:hypothetical protein
MDDYQETRLHEPDPPPAMRKALKRRRWAAWALYALGIFAALALLLSGVWWHN